MLAHFYHVYADGAWQDPLTEHLAALDASGLGAALDVKAAGIVGSPANCQAAIAALGPAWQIAVTAGTGFEHVTLAQAPRVRRARREGAVRAHQGRVGPVAAATSCGGGG